MSGPDHPVFIVPAIEKLRDRMIDRVFLQHYNETPDSQGLARLTEQIVRELPAGATRDAVFESLRHLAGHELTPAECARVAWRLAGNLPRLREGLAATPWTVQVVPEWVPLTILRCVEHRDQKNKLGFNFDFRVEAGSPCPMRITNFWRAEFLRPLSRRLGFSAINRKYPFYAAPDMVGLRLLAKLEPVRSQTQPGFFDVLVPDNLQKWNIEEVLRYRLHIVPCPNNWTHPCRRCAVGYDLCRAATHAVTYVQQACETCGEDTFFDPERGMLRCIACDIKERTRRK